MRAESQMVNAQLGGGKKMNAQVKKLIAEKNGHEARIKQINMELNKLESECRPKPRYGNRKVETDTALCGIFDRVPEGTEYVRITEYLLNENEKNEHIEAFGTVMGSWDASRRSVSYFRINGILLHEGGGYVIMKQYMECSDAEWEQIKQGNIPERLSNTKL